MRLRHFIASSSVVLIAWLAGSYFHPLPAKRVVAAEPGAATTLHAAEGVSAPEVVESDGLAVSVSP